MLLYDYIYLLRPCFTIFAYMVQKLSYWYLKSECLNILFKPCEYTMCGFGFSGKVWIQRFRWILHCVFLFSFFLFFFAFTCFREDTKFTIHETNVIVHALFTGPTTLFTHLKFILLQCFQFSISAKISSIQTDPMFWLWKPCFSKKLSIGINIFLKSSPLHLAWYENFTQLCGKTLSKQCYLAK